MEFPDLGKGIDSRIRCRYKTFSKSLLFGNKVSIQSISQNRAEQIANYRLLHNPKLSEEILIKEIKSRCSKAVAGKVVLCLHDSSEANFFKHTGRLKPDTGLGPIDAAKKGIGFKMHDSLVLDAKSFYPYGISHIDLWTRDNDRDSKAWENRKKPVEDKESSKWARGCLKSEETLSMANTIIHIQDREGDIYDQIADFNNKESVFHIIRSRYDRVTKDGHKISEHLKNSPVIGTYTLEVSSDSHSKRKRRTAVLEVRSINVVLNKPMRASNSLPEESKTITVIQAREINAPENIDPLNWQLLTSCTVSDFEDAFQVIDWYGARWSIEEFYRVLKKENFDIESSELETGWALRKLSIIAMDTSLKVFQVMYCREIIEEGETLETICSFSEHEFECLSMLNQKLQGKTEKQKNPFQDKSTAWAVWIFSRLGGWKGYSSQRKPGATTILLGMTKFYQIYSGYALSVDVCTR